MSIDWTKPILWDGKPARVLATDLAPDDVPLAIIRDEAGKDRWCRIDGTLGGHQRVTNAPERVERWANVYEKRQDISSSHPTRETADTCAASDRTSLLHSTFEGDKLVDVAIVPLEPAS